MWCNFTSSAKLRSYDELEKHRNSYETDLELRFISSLKEKKENSVSNYSNPRRWKSWVKFHCGILQVDGELI